MTHDEYLDDEHAITLALAAVEVVLVDGRRIQRCPPGVAANAYYLRNRGLLLDYEVTVWPSANSQRFILTTGGGNGPRHLASGERSERFVVSQLEVELAAAVGIEVHEFVDWATRWRSEALNKPTLKQKKLHQHSAVEWVEEHMRRSRPRQVGIIGREILAYLGGRLQ